MKTKHALRTLITQEITQILVLCPELQTHTPIISQLQTLWKILRHFLKILNYRMIQQFHFWEMKTETQEIYLYTHVHCSR